MNYKKLAQVLKQNGLVDDRNLICHSRRSYTVTSDKWIYQEFNKIENEKVFPAQMILSICDDHLYISYANIFGKYKKVYKKIPLQAILFQKKYTVDKNVDICTFEITDKEMMINYTFFIIADKYQDKTKALVKSIIDYSQS